jgi:hypothetical protein
VIKILRTSMWLKYNLAFHKQTKNIHILTNTYPCILTNFTNIQSRIGKFQNHAKYYVCNIGLWIEPKKEISRYMLLGKLCSKISWF